MQEFLIRTISAAILIPMGLVSVWFGGSVLAGFVMLFGCLAVWEWCQMIEFPSLRSRVMLTGLVGLMPLLAYFLPFMAFLMVLLLPLGIFFCSHGKSSKYRWLSLGVFYCGSAMISIMIIRESLYDGMVLTLAMMSMVWVSDIFAFLVGRLVGGAKLAPMDSPNKTWSGAIGAVLGSALVGLVFAKSLDTSWLLWICVGIIIGIVALIGDLFESRIKRNFGKKDSGNIIPGHGGVLDRLDALMAVSIFVAIIVLIHPNFALLLTGAR